MIDGPSAIDPLVAEGPLAPVESLRPLPSLQRVVVLDTQRPHMVDLGDGNVRPYENGPPVSVPMSSTRFDLAALARLQVQVLRDPRPFSSDLTLFSMHLADARVVLDVRETPNGKLVLDDGRQPPSTSPVGQSNAVVVVVEHNASEEGHQITLSARNAETLDSSSITVHVSSLTNTMVTMGGPMAETTGQFGRRRAIPVLIDTTLAAEPIEQMRRAVRGAKRVAVSLRDRIG